jgi:restriction endonuclease S subunit
MRSSSASSFSLFSPLGPMPNGWKLARLQDITTKIGSGATPRGGSKVYLSTRKNYVLVRSQHVFDRYFDRQGLVFISDEHAAELSKVALHPRDVLLNITGDGITFGRSCIVPEDVLPACVNQHVSIIRANPEVCVPEYLLCYLTHPAIKGYIESFNAGGSRRAITKGHIESFEVALPPIAEQKAIAHILGTLDDKIELNQQMNRTLEGIARTLFKSWFIDFDPVRAKLDGRQPSGMDAETAALFPDTFEDGDEIGPIPKGWSVSSLDKLFPKDKGCVITGPFGSNLHAHDYREKGIPLILVKHVNNGRIQEQNLPLVGSHKFPELSRYLLEEGDIIFTRVGAVGRTAYIYPKYVGWLISGQTLRVRINNREVLNPRYLAQVYLEPSFIQMVEAQALGTTRPSLNTKILKAFNFLLPSIRVQNRFIQRAHAAVGGVVKKRGCRENNHCTQ